MLGRKKVTGFTLLEVLAVVAIIGILSALIIPRVANSVDEARLNTCEANIKYLEGLLERYKLAKGEYPENSQTLLNWSQQEYPICPLDGSLEGNDTGYYYNKDSGKVGTQSGEGWINLVNNDD